MHDSIARSGNEKVHWLHFAKAVLLVRPVRQGNITIMNSTQLLMEGVELMVLGMGAVFVFLIMLVGCISLMSRLVNHFTPAVPETAVTSTRRPAVASTAAVDPHTLAAISAAVRLHRSRADHQV